MPLYRIERRTGPLTNVLLKSAAARAAACVPRFPGVKWHRSYFDANEGVLTCFYDAPDEDSVRRHAQAAQLACDVVSEVLEVLPPR